MKDNQNQEAMIKCSMCGAKFNPIIKEHYISEDVKVTGIATAIRCEG